MNSQSTNTHLIIAYTYGCVDQESHFSTFLFLMLHYHRRNNKSLMTATTLVLLLLGLLMFNPEITAAQSVGVCYGGNANADNLPTDQNEAVNLCRANGIGRIRIYSAYPEIFDALKGSNIEVLVDVGNDKIQSLADAAAVADWFQKYVKSYWPDVKFKYIAVGNEVNASDARAQYILPAMKNIYSEIVSANLQNQIKVSVVIDTNLLEAFSPPSAGVFKESEKATYIEPIIRFLVINEAPLLANIYPYFRVKFNNEPVPYALFTEQSVFEYRNLFDALMDALYSSVEKAGGSNLKVVVTESGWPSAGGAVETIENAGTYYRNLINHVKGGTPKRPGQALETYLFSLFDENKKEPEIEKHFGLFFSDKQPKYNINFN